MRTFRILTREGTADKFKLVAHSKAEYASDILTKLFAIGFETTHVKVEPMPLCQTDIERMHDDALQVQDACNLSGVLHSFLRNVQELRDMDLSSEDINRHPVSVLFSSKVASLTGSESATTFHKAYEAAQLITGQDPIGDEVKAEKKAAKKNDPNLLVDLFPARKEGESDEDYAQAIERGAKRFRGENV